MSESKKSVPTDNDASPFGMIRSNAGAEWERLWEEAAARGRARLDARKHREEGRLRRTFNALLCRLSPRPIHETPPGGAPPPADDKSDELSEAEAVLLPLRLMCQPGAVVIARAARGNVGHLVILQHPSAGASRARWVGVPMCALASGHGKSAQRSVWEPVAPAHVPKLARCPECIHHAQTCGACQGRPCSFLSTTLLRGGQETKDNARA